MDLQGVEPQILASVEIYSGVPEGNLSFSTLFPLISSLSEPCLLPKFHLLPVAPGKVIRTLLSLPLLPPSTSKCQAADPTTSAASLPTVYLGALFPG